MEFKPQFFALEQLIIEKFSEVMVEMGVDASVVRLVLTDDPISATAPTRASFSVLPNGTVTLRWAGIASLWAACQAFSRLQHQASEARQNGTLILQTDAGSIAGDGVMFFDLARQLITLTGPPKRGQAVRWSDLPAPDSSTKDTIVCWGNILFIESLGWIMRHEISHITLQHDARQIKEGHGDAFYEEEADHNATDVYCKGLEADKTRALSQPPGDTEIRLERRAMATGFGLLWVMLLETSIGRSSPKHPPIAERLSTCLDRLSLPDDSIALDAIATMINVLVDPQADRQPAQTSRDAFQNALVELHRLMQQFDRD